MQRKSFGKLIWEIASPILVHLGVTFLVEMVFLMAYYLKSLPELVAAMESEEALMEFVMETANIMYEYVVELTAITALATLPFLIWMRKRDKRKENAVGIVPNKKAPLSKYFLIAGISIPFAVGFNNILTLSNLGEYSIAYQETAEALYTPSFFVQIVCLGLIVPITEEFIFRGLIYKRMRMNTSPMRAIFSSALFFGIYHGNSVQMIYGTICGLLMAYLYEKYGSIKAPIFAHMLMNIVACILTEVDGFTWMFVKPVRMAIITIACAAIASTMFLFIRDINEKPELDEDVKEVTI